MTGPLFGEENQLKIIGWSGRNKLKDGAKFYILKCSICSKDSELFGDGVFKRTKSDLLKGVIPCGCSKVPRWTTEQYIIRCARQSNKLGYMFKGIVDDGKGVFSKIILNCPKHGDWNTCTIKGLVDKSLGCPKCKGDKNKINKSKPDELMIQSFFATEQFSEGTKFWRSDRKTKQGAACFWWVHCPTCEEVVESKSDNLQTGKKPCSCGRMRQKECYINLVKDQGNIVCLKFGIANNSKFRLYSQNRKSIFSVENLFVYKFSSVHSCKSAERECKQSLTSCIISKEEMPDGYTETTHLYNLEKIIEIYEKHGGIRIN